MSKEVTVAIICAVLGVIAHMGMFGVFSRKLVDQLFRKLSDQSGFVGGDDEEEDDPNSEDAFMDGLFGSKHETKTNTALATEDDGGDDDDVFGNSAGEKVNYEGDDEGSSDDEEAEEGLLESGKGTKKADHTPDEEEKPGKKGKPDGLDGVDLDSVSDDDIIDMIADPGYTSREKGFLKQMHADRRKRQEAQAQIDHYRLALKAKDMGHEEPENEEDEDIDPFEGKEDDDFMSVADVKKVLEKKQEAERRELEKAQKKMMADKERQASQIQELEKIEASMKAVNPDYEDMMRCAAAAMFDEPALAHKMNQIAASGGNAVEYCYKLGKRYSPVYLEAIKKGSNNANGDGTNNTANNNASRIANNARKKKTSASLGSGRASTSKGVDIDALDAMEMDDLVKTLYNMPPKVLVKVPRRIRDRALGGTQ